MIGYLIDVENDKARMVEINGDDHLKQFYDLIGCRCIDICTRKIGKKYYNIVLDDEGLLVSDPVFSAIDKGMNGMLAGNLIIFGIGDDQDLCSIEDTDPANIRANMYEVLNFDKLDFDTLSTHPVVVMDY